MLTRLFLRCQHTLSSVGVVSWRFAEVRELRDGLRSIRNNVFHHWKVTSRKIRRFRTFHDKSQECHGIRRHHHLMRVSNPAEDFGAKTPKAELEFATPAPALKEW
jgi:hypothetical protein